MNFPHKHLQKKWKTNARCNLCERPAWRRNQYQKTNSGNFSALDFVCARCLSGMSKENA